MLELNEKSGKILESEKLLTVDCEYDVVVVGGGIAGIGAAIAAARAGCRTLVIEMSSSLGGLATIGLVNIPLDHLSGIGKEMFKRLEEVDALWHCNTDPEKHKLILDRMVRESGCDILFVTYVVDSIVRNGAICGVVVESKSGRKVILAKRVVDCSGDADAAFFAGCEYEVGRAEDGLPQGCSLEFRLGGVEWDKYVNSELKSSDPYWIEFVKNALKTGDLPYEVDNHLNWMTHVPGRPEHCGKDEVSICFAHSRNCKPLCNHDLTRMYLEGREQCDMLWKFIKKCVPGFESCWLIDTGTLLGVRDSRRITGEYILNAYDVASRAKFDDVIAISWRGFDIHNPTGPGNLRWVEWELNGQKRYIVAHKGGLGGSAFPPGGKEVLCDYQGKAGKDLVFSDDPQMSYYDIPYRSLVPLHVDNLLVAGRCLSADFPAQAATRLVMCCNAMGEAAGVAAAISLKRGITPRQVDRIELQQVLLKNNCTLGLPGRVIPGLQVK